ncbi:J domain-containing protein [Thiocapsa imhoffii]|nr:J domain-containing protein [Thiocapsa imhoffii]
MTLSSVSLRPEMLTEELDSLLIWLANPDNPAVATLDAAIRETGLTRQAAIEQAYRLLDAFLFSGAISDPHQVLGLPPGVDRATAKRRYRRLMLAYHPDRHPGCSTVRSRRTEQLNLAYAALEYAPPGASSSGPAGSAERGATPSRAASDPVDHEDPRARPEPMTPTRGRHRRRQGVWAFGTTWTDEGHPARMQFHLMILLVVGVFSVGALVYGSVRTLHPVTASPSPLAPEQTVEAPVLERGLFSENAVDERRAVPRLASDPIIPSGSGSDLDTHRDDDMGSEPTVLAGALPVVADPTADAISGRQDLTELVLEAVSVPAGPTAARDVAPGASVRAEPPAPPARASASTTQHQDLAERVQRWVASPDLIAEHRHGPSAAPPREIPLVGLTPVYSVPAPPPLPARPRQEVREPAARAVTAPSPRAEPTSRADRVAAAEPPADVPRDQTRDQARNQAQDQSRDQAKSPSKDQTQEPASRPVREQAKTPAREPPSPPRTDGSGDTPSRSATAAPAVPPRVTAVVTAPEPSPEPSPESPPVREPARSARTPAVAEPARAAVRPSPEPEQRVVVAPAASPTARATPSPRAAVEPRQAPRPDPKPDPKPDPQPSLEDRCAATASRLDAFQHAYNAGALEQLMALYAANANENGTQGRSAIAALYRDWFATTSERRLRFTSVRTRAEDGGRCGLRARFLLRYLNERGLSINRNKSIDILFDGAGADARILEFRY